MTESVNAPLPPSIFGLPEEILEVLGPEVVARIESDWARVCQGWGALQFQMQLFEAVVAIAAPALLAPVDDAAAAEAVLAESKDRRLHNAIGLAVGATRGRVTLPEDIEERMHQARDRRNELTHDVLPAAMLAILTDRTDALLAEFDADFAMFESITAELSPVFEHAVTERGLDVESMQLANAGIVTFITSHPEIADGMKHLDIEELGDRLVRSVQASGHDCGDAEIALPEA